MSYLCHATNEMVMGEPRVLVPVQIRKVIYIAQTRPDEKVDYVQFASQTEGWEIVKEVPVRGSKATEFQATHTPEVVGEPKEVRYMKPRPPREKFVRRNDDQDNDKPDAGL